MKLQSESAPYMLKSFRRTFENNRVKVLFFRSTVEAVYEELVCKIAITLSPTLKVAYNLTIN